MAWDTSGPFQGHNNLTMEEFAVLTSYFHRIYAGRVLLSVLYFQIVLEMYTERNTYNKIVHLFVRVAIVTSQC
jgi:hypothetical protein